MYMFHITNRRNDEVAFWKSGYHICGIIFMSKVYEYL